MECELLAQETFELSEHLQDLYHDAPNPWKDNFVNDPLFQEEKKKRSQQKIERDFPLESGLVFLVRETPNTFCLRGQAVFQIRPFAQKILEREINSLEAFRGEYSCPEELNFFSTKNLSQAEIIYEQLFHRRFSKDQDLLGHLTDRDFSWWLESKEDFLKVYFSNRGHRMGRDLLRLGPLGDKKVASSRFGKAAQLLAEIFSSPQLLPNSEGFELKRSEAAQEFFSGMLSILQRGENPFVPTSFGERRELKTLYLYFDEISCIRRFWLFLEKILEKKA